MQKIFNGWYILILLGLLLTGSCTKKYNHTVKVCEGSLYVEIFDVNPAGVSVHYLTDTSNFRLFVGEYDNEHENFSYKCEGDTLVIFKLKSSSQPGGKNKVSVIQKYSITELKKKKVFE